MKIDIYRLNKSREKIDEIYFLSNETIDKVCEEAIKMNIFDDQEVGI